MITGKAAYTNANDALEQQFITISSKLLEQHSNLNKTTATGFLNNSIHRRASQFRDEFALPNNKLIFTDLNDNDNNITNNIPLSLLDSKKRKRKRDRNSNDYNNNSTNNTSLNSSSISASYDENGNEMDFLSELMPEGDIDTNLTQIDKQNLLESGVLDNNGNAISFVFFLFFIYFLFFVLSLHKHSYFFIFWQFFVF